MQFRLKEFQEGDVPWDYRIEVGDNMEVRLTAPMGETEDYKIDVGDLIGISFLNNWPLNSNRTVRPDGNITMPEIGDVKAAGLTPLALRKKLTDLYAKTGIIEGEPRITVNVDFSNADRSENISRDIVVLPDGKCSPVNEHGRDDCWNDRPRGWRRNQSRSIQGPENKPDVNLIRVPRD